MNEMTEKSKNDWHDAFKKSVEFQMQIKKVKDYTSRLAVAGSLAGVVVGITGLMATVNNDSSEKGQTLDQRIERLTTSLTIASKNISDIEREIEQRKQLVSQLQTDANEAQKLKTLNADQVAAVAQALRGQLKEESRDSFWSSTLTNIIFAFLGALFGEAIRWIRSKYAKIRTA